jgi:GTP-binding protein
VLELKLIADVGLVGKPNAGKSTLLSAISDAHPKVADYPFTTLSPALGVVGLPDFRSFVVADIPGIIEGAHEGKGLGLQFLRHIERTRALALLIPLDCPDLQSEYDQLREELGSYSEDLLRTPHCVVFTKSDLLGPSDEPPSVKADSAWQSFVVSAVARTGLSDLLEALYAQTHEDPEAAQDPLEDEEWWVPEE